jgi:hypothetical protein
VQTRDAIAASCCRWVRDSEARKIQNPLATNRNKTPNHLERQDTDESCCRDGTNSDPLA